MIHNVIILICCLSLRYLVKYQTSTPLGTEFIFSKWWRENAVDFIISLVCLPLIFYFAEPLILHFNKDVEFKQDTIHAKAIYALGGYAGSDIIRSFMNFYRNKIKRIITRDDTTKGNNI